MAQENFDECVKFVISLEGGYVNDPNDPGGETKYGIAKRYHSKEDIKNLTIERAKEIYKEEYWGPAGCDNLPNLYDLVVFDTAVQYGFILAKQVGQHENGSWERVLLWRMNKYFSYAENNLDARRTFFFGWMRRLSLLYNYCHSKELEKTGGLL